MTLPSQRPRATADKAQHLRGRRRTGQHTEEDTWRGPWLPMTLPVKAGSAEHADRGEHTSAKDATTSEFSAACTANCTHRMPESQLLGWRPVWLAAKLDTTRCRERKTPQVDRQGRVGGSNRVQPRLKTRFPLFVFTFVRGCHTESPANSLREVSLVSLQLTAEGRGLPVDRYQFWGWCPLKFQKGAAPVRPPSGRIPRRHTPVHTPPISDPRCSGVTIERRCPA